MVPWFDQLKVGGLGIQTVSGMAAVGGQADLGNQAALNNQAELENYLAGTISPKNEVFCEFCLKQLKLHDLCGKSLDPDNPVEDD